ASMGAAEGRTLPNGLRVIIDARPATETVAMRLLIAGGDVADPPGKTSAARLHAALLLRGTREKTGFALARAAEELGGRLTAYSRALAESGSLSLPAENAEAGLRPVRPGDFEPSVAAAGFVRGEGVVFD